MTRASTSRRASGPTERLTGRATFTEAYAVIPKGVMRDIVTNHLPL
ncbi:(S)-ureidoglycine aminohydrolase [Pandoraea horticolens]|uniref:(S)-ureidoglycine aminohydrolase n=1 Tax=Pandoraea horticolens TaxID=2508298 RepID=A0A5E4X9S3_9BURK|nr:(S)-ureidoglycine aminohydrolase [Pandoraea horticolens]